MSELTTEEARLIMREYHLRPCETSLLKELILYSTRPDFNDSFLVDPDTGPVCVLFAEDPKNDVSFVEYSTDIATGLDGDTSLVCFCQSHTTGNYNDGVSSEVATRYRLYFSKVVVPENMSTDLTFEAPSTEVFFNNHADCNKYLANVIVNGICLPRSSDESEEEYQYFIQQRNDIIEIARKYL